MDIPKIHEGEYRFCLILLKHEPVTAAQLAKLCQEQLGWKRTTTYTIIKRLGERGILKNENGLVTALVSQDEAQACEIDELVEKKFRGVSADLHRRVYQAAGSVGPGAGRGPADGSDASGEEKHDEYSLVQRLRSGRRLFPRPYHEPLGQLDRGSGAGATAVPEAGAEVGKRAALGHVAARLVLPVSIESPLSLLPRTEAILPAAAAQPIQTGTAPAVGSAAAIASGAAMRSQPGWTTILAWVWLVGIAVLLLYTWISTQRLRRKVREAVRLQGNIYETEHIASPFVLGVLRPRIYLPYHMDSRDQEQVIAHEQAHLRRGDHVWKPLGFLLLTIHWFNPLLWLSYVLLCRDIELACDEKVIKNLSCGQRADYMQALVTCSVNRRRIAACPLAFGEIGVKERVRSVMHYKKPTFWIILLAVAACVVLAVCFLTNPIGFRYDAAADPIVSAKYFDARNHTDPIAVDLSAAQIDELSSRLDGLKNAKTSDTLAGWTPMYQISAQLQDGSISGPTDIPVRTTRRWISNGTTCTIW
ncbi:MAG: M56 family metallopeptidase [Oscillospiraceae bacterium]